MIKKYSVPLSLLALALLILLFGWGNYLFLLQGSRDLLASVEKLEQAVEQNNWESAGNCLNEIRTAWQKVDRYWPMLVHHEEMDRIEESMNKLKSYIKYKDSAQTLAELYNLYYYIKHIPQKEAFNLQNIF